MRNIFVRENPEKQRWKRRWVKLGLAVALGWALTPVASALWLFACLIWARPTEAVTTGVIFAQEKIVHLFSRAVLTTVYLLTLFPIGLWPRRSRWAQGATDTWRAVKPSSGFQDQF